MGLIIAVIITAYLFTGAVLGGILDDERNNSITDGVLNRKFGVMLCVFLWPLLIALAAAITVLNAGYLVGRKAKGKIKFKRWRKG